MAKLASYRAKRDFTKTSEPTGRSAGKAGSSFVVQKHDASRLHYDFRLEMDGVLKSWAVAKGPSLIPGEKRLAVEVEDHPVAYGDFEGTIPEEQYGGGTVMLWDRGTWEPENDPHEDYAKGRLTFELHGEKLKGKWHLVRMRGRPKERQVSWLLIKSDDDEARTEEDPNILEESPLSVKTGRSLDEIAGGKLKKSAAKKPAAPRKPDKPKPARSSSSSRGMGEAIPSPMPTEIEPCLATLVAEVPTGDDWLHEVKWDGYRVLAFIADGKARLVTRNGKDWTKRFPKIGQSLEALPVETAIIDGEAIAEDENGIPSFAALQQALSNTSKQIADKAIYQAFDLLYLDGMDLRPLPLEKRKAELKKRLVSADPTGALRYSDHKTANGAAMVRNVCSRGLEGVVSKRRDLPYRSGRNEDWVKTKCTNQQEFVIAGYIPSTAIKNAVGSLVLSYYEKDKLVYAGRSGTGFTVDLARDLYKRLSKLETKTSPFSEKLTTQQRRGIVWVKPELLGEVEFRGWTTDKIVRHAAFKGLREDKSPREVVKEKKRVLPVRQSKAGSKTMNAATAEVAGVPLTHPDRVLWQDAGITKQQLAEFYVGISDWLLPHLINRPLTLMRCPSGVQGGCFVQRHSWAGLSEFVQREMARDESGEQEILYVKDIQGVVALVQAGALEMHVWGATIDALNRADRLIFDLDPGEGIEWSEVIEGALGLRERLKTLDLESFVKITGGKGLHVVAPLDPAAPWKEALAFARDLAEAMAADEPDRYTTTSVKKERQGKIFIDYLRNNREASAVAPYSTRARSGAPVSAPLAWSELSADLKPNAITVATLPQRLKKLRKDPWVDLRTIKQGLPKTGCKGRKAKG